MIFGYFFGCVVGGCNAFGCVQLARGQHIGGGMLLLTGFLLWLAARRVCNAHARLVERVFDELLRSILGAMGEASGLEIQRALMLRADHKFSLTSVYRTLGNLEARGAVAHRWVESGPERRRKQLWWTTGKQS